ncbi:hypothetical protein [Streptomyces sp. NPDC048521]|uniref:hypothetical protein n=1 Tax=Streptomyces sp. NPDC048521 TaxID=3365566 RepID=UPI003721A242
MGSALFWKRLHMVLFFAWVALLPPTLLWWRNSIAYVVLMSWYAIAIGHVSSWQASRAEEEATEE